jgi:hypothetical protein
MAWISKGKIKPQLKKKFQEYEEKIIKGDEIHSKKGDIWSVGHWQSRVFIVVKSLQEASFVIPRFCELACLTLFLNRRREIERVETLWHSSLHIL